MITLPEKLKVGGFWYDIEHCDSLDDANCSLALHDSGRLCIKVAKTFNNKPIAEQWMLEAFTHEMLHAVNRTYNCDKLTERDIVTLGRGWYYTLSRNFLDIRSTKIPSSLDIMGFHYEITYPYVFEDYLYDSVTISVRSSQGSIYLADEDSFTTLDNRVIKSELIYGIFLAITYIMSSDIQEKSDEDYCNELRVMGYGLYQVLVDNNLEELFRNHYEDLQRMQEEG
jgi:hypothetical protein